MASPRLSYLRRGDATTKRSLDHERNTPRGSDAADDYRPTRNPLCPAGARGDRRLFHDHPEVISPLLEAVEVVPTYFGPGATLALELERDMEGRSGRIDLFALILTEFGIDAALTALDRFDDEWWLHNQDRTNGSLMFSIEHV